VIVQLDIQTSEEQQSVGMYVNHEFTVTVIITKMCTISTFKRSIMVNMV